MKDEISVFERQIFSLALLEKELHQLYNIISKKIDDVAAKTLFSYIASDCLKHSRILDIINDEVDCSRVREQDCAQTLMYTKKLIRSHINDVKKGKISQEELETLMNELLDFENLLLNEYKKAFHLHSTKFGGLKQERYHEDVNVFTLIVSDEGRHQEILIAIANLLKNRLSIHQNSPVVKYQNPDSWYLSTR